MTIDEYQTDPLYESRLAGFAEGWEARQPEVDRLNEVADRWYLRATNTPAELREIEQRQLDRHFEEQDRAFFGGAA